MKSVLYDRIICTDNDWFDHRYRFLIARNPTGFPTVDLAESLLQNRNDAVDTKKDPKLWNEVYPSERELRIFQETIEQALRKNKKLHIVNCSLREELEIVRQLYLDLGYFDLSENCFRVDFQNAPITAGINIRNIAYSTKDYKSKRDAIYFIPPPRTPGDVKGLFAAINSGVIATITVNDVENESNLLETLIQSEKTNLLHLANLLYWNWEARGFKGEKEEWITTV